MQPHLPKPSPSRHHELAFVSGRYLILADYRRLGIPPAAAVWQ
jgi:hypothetical protein